MSSAQVSVGLEDEAERQQMAQKDDEKQRQLDQKMEEMRRKNELLRRRYEEIEADKRNANVNSRIAGTKLEDEEGDYDSEEDDQADKRRFSQHGRGRSGPKGEPRRELPKVGKGRGRLLPNESTMPYQKPGQPNRGGLSPQNAPPPDPRYNFLSDPLRSSNQGGERQDGGNGDFRRGAGRVDQRNMPLPPKGRGMRFGPPDSESFNRPKDANYSRWKEERERIDAERLARQQTSSGQWKREWDNDKQVQRYDDDQHFGGRRDNRVPSGGYHRDDRQHQQRDFQRMNHEEEGGHSIAQHRYGRQSSDGNRRVYDDGQSVRVNVHHSKGHDSGRRGRGFPARGQQYRGDMGAPSYDEESDARNYGFGNGSREQFPSQMSDQQGQRKQRPQVLEDKRAQDSHKQGSGFDTPSPEYASPEPRQPVDSGCDENEPVEKGRGLVWAEDQEEEQWEDVDEDGEDAGDYHQPTGNADHAAVEEEEGEEEDEDDLRLKLEEMERRIQSGEPQSDVESAANCDQNQIRSDTATAVQHVPHTEQYKEAGPVRRRYTADGVGEGPEIVVEEAADSRVERSRQESMDQIERDMIARLDENIQAAEAALGHSEEDLDKLLASSCQVAGAPMLEGADEDGETAASLKRASPKPAEDDGAKDGSDGNVVKSELGLSLDAEKTQAGHKTASGANGTEV